MIFTDFLSRKKYRVDEIFYRIGKVIWLPFCLVGFWFSYGGYQRFGGWMACSIREICGLPCPGCGTTRAFYYLFRGNLIKSFRLNPTVIYGVLAYLHFMARYFYHSHISGLIQEKEIRITTYLYIAIGVMLVQWAVKVARVVLTLKLIA